MRKHRRLLPRSLQEPFLDLLLECRTFIVPEAGRSVAAKIKEARSEVAELMLLCRSLATVQVQSPVLRKAAGDGTTLSSSGSGDELGELGTSSSEDGTNSVRAMELLGVRCDHQSCQTTISLPLVDRAALVADNPLGAISMGLSWLAREAYEKHQACRARTKSILDDVVGVELEQSECITYLGGGYVVPMPCKEAELPASAYTSAIGEMLTRKHMLGACVRAFFGWRAVISTSGEQRRRWLCVGGWWESPPQQSIIEAFEKLECRAAHSRLVVALEGEARLKLLDEVVELLCLGGGDCPSLTGAAMLRIEDIMQEVKLARLIARRSSVVFDTIAAG